MLGQGILGQRIRGQRIFGQGIRAALVLGLGVGLAGCQGVLHTLGLAHDNSVMARAIAPKLPEGETSALQTGRAMLDAGQPGNAIEAFQRALGAGEPVAPALNGLGVAYAQLGRLDLAQRYFQEATVIAPQDARFAENLAKLVRSPAYAALNEPAVPQVASSASAPTVPSGNIERLSANEVRIRTAAPMAAPVAAVRYAEAPKGFVPLVRIPLNGAADDTAPAPDVVAKPAAPARAQARPVAVTGFRPLVRIQLAPLQATSMQRVSRGEVRITSQAPSTAAPESRMAVRDDNARVARKGQPR